jgi:hypothetical protein
MKKHRYIFGFGNYLTGDYAYWNPYIRKIETQFNSDNSSASKW